MTHDRNPHDRNPPAKTGAPSEPRRARYRSFEGLADIDDVMRQLSDLAVFAPLCRRRACNRAGRCQGGYGPPCLFEAPEVFIAHIKGGTREMRRFWKRQRALARMRPSPARGGDGE
jgi:hypothetical protein